MENERLDHLKDCLMELVGECTDADLLDLLLIVLLESKK